MLTFLMSNIVLLVDFSGIGMIQEYRAGAYKSIVSWAGIAGGYVLGYKQYRRKAGTKSKQIRNILETR